MITKVGDHPVETCLKLASYRFYYSFGDSNFESIDYYCCLKRTGFMATTRFTLTAYTTTTCSTYRLRWINRRNQQSAINVENNRTVRIRFKLLIVWNWRFNRKVNSSLAHQNWPGDRDHSTVGHIKYIIQFKFNSFSHRIRQSWKTPDQTSLK